MFKKTILFILVTVFLFSQVSAQKNEAELNNNANFSGVWELEKVSNNTILYLNREAKWMEQKIRRISIKQNETSFVLSVLDNSSTPIMEMNFNLSDKGEKNLSPFRIVSREKGTAYPINETFESFTKINKRTISSKAIVKIVLGEIKGEVSRRVEFELSEDGKNLSEKVWLEKSFSTQPNSFFSDVTDKVDKIWFIRKYKLVK